MQIGEMQVPGENSINSSRRLTIYYHCSSRARHAIIWFTAVKGTKELSTKVAIFAPENRYSHGAYLTALSSLLRLFYYGGAYMSRSRCIKKGAKLLENAVQRALSHDVPARDVKRDGERHVCILKWVTRFFRRYKRSIFLNGYLLRDRWSYIVKKEKEKGRKEKNRIECDCVMSMLAINRRSS